MPHTRKRSSYPKPLSLSNKSFFDYSLVAIWKDGLKSRFWIKNFTTCQILAWKKYNALDFELKLFPHVRFWKFVCIQKITFWFILLRENDIFRIFRAFLKSMILHWKFHYVLDFDLKKNNASDFDFKKTQRVRLWNEIFSSSQILNKKFNNVSDFKFKIFLFFNLKF